MEEYNAEVEGVYGKLIARVHSDGSASVTGLGVTGKEYTTVVNEESLREIARVATAAADHIKYNSYTVEDTYKDWVGGKIDSHTAMWQVGEALGCRL